MVENKKIVISGTYGTGKTTLTNELAKLTGIPVAVARGMREILPETFPGKKLEECNPSELIQLGIIRYGERVCLEKSAGNSFISDGSAIHEWAYGYGRQIEGANGRGTELTSPEYEFGMKAFGEIVKRHAKKSYTHIIHLPVEFPLNQDGHRPVSEDFRSEANEILLKTWSELGFQPIIIKGTIEERLEQTIRSLNLTRSTTTNGGRKEGEVTYFDRMDDVLGDSSKRFFSNGFRQVNHDIRNIGINLGEQELTADLCLSYRGDFAVKDGKACKPHLSSIDSILVMGQLAQAFLYTKDGLRRDQCANMWLRDLEIKTGNKPIEDCENIRLKGKIDDKYITRKGITWHLASIVGELGDNGFTVTARVGYELPSTR